MAASPIDLMVPRNKTENRKTENKNSNPRTQILEMKQVKSSQGWGYKAQALGSP